MKKVEKIKKPLNVWNPYPSAIKRELIQRFGCDGTGGNFIIDGEYPDSLIKTIGSFISKHDGSLTEYQIWFSEPIQKWRLVFGR